MFHHQKSKLRDLLCTSLFTLLISMQSYATDSIITIERGYKEIDVVAMNRVESYKTKSQDSIRSFNGNLISKSRMDAFIRYQMDSLNMSGLSIAFVNDDEMVYHNALGFKNIETQERVDNSSIFDAASLSKTVFSFYAMKVVEQGLLDLDTPLYKYMEYPDIAYDERYKLITARIVLSQRSGFPNLRYIDEDGNYDPNRKLTIEFQPGTKYQYSGEGYEYLAKVIAHLKGVEKNELQSLIKTAVFEPLAMEKSSFVWNDYLEKNRVDGHFRGKVNDGYGTSKKYPNFKASSSLQTNAKEYSYFLKALINNKILSKKSHEELTKIQSIKKATKKSTEMRYGLGVIIEASEYGINYSHGGDNLSHTSLYYFNKEKKVGYVFFTNSENRNKFHQNLLDFLLTN
ncbi:serine hydrolase domain-containing protein [Winogradskyella flava]|uniref:serine hydrolase domain-containing protein n=1 Tax=Winogradskyella flava TaxID=1884876 RepID=UPI0024906153|nr:serine hydrolase domain-containing protein [Winogradskyella flava]